MANPRFIDNGDGTVTLPALGLMFTKATVTPECVTQHQAEAACAELRTAGHDDWRLPSTHELFALVDDTRIAPAIDTAFFPETQNDWYWTSTVCAWSSARAWLVFFGSGDCNGCRRVNVSGLVRAVRSVPAGYVPVPVEPTTAMKCRAVEAWEGPAAYKSIFARGLADLEDKAAECWDAMLADALAAADKENNP